MRAKESYHSTFYNNSMLFTVTPLGRDVPEEQTEAREPQAQGKGTALSTRRPAAAEDDNGKMRSETLFWWFLLCP